MTKISDEDITPKVDKAIDQSDIEFSLDTSSRIQVAGNLSEKIKVSEPTQEPEKPSEAKTNPPIQIFKASADQNAMVSTRYQE